MSSEQAELVRAAQFFKEKAQHLLADDHGVQLEALVQSLARMAGSYGFKSMDMPPPLPPGSVVLAPEADDIGKRIASVFFATLNALGAAVTPTNLDNGFAATYSQRFTIKEAEERLAPIFADYIKSQSLKNMSAALACVIAAALSISEGRGLLAPQKTAALVAYGIVEGIKTVPFY